MNEKYNVYLVSDSTGETLDRIFLALKAQFKDFDYDTNHFSFTRTENQIKKIFEKINKKKKIIILYTIVDSKLSDFLTNESEKENKQDRIFESLIDFYKVLVSGDSKNIEIALREFEYFLICELGYGFNFLYDDNGKKIVREKTYYFHPAQGFSEKPLNNFLKVSGIDIIDFTNGKITSSSARSKIRKIMQLAISYIAEKPLNAGLIFND